MVENHGSQWDESARSLCADSKQLMTTGIERINLSLFCTDATKVA